MAGRESEGRLARHFDYNHFCHKTCICCCYKDHILLILRFIEYFIVGCVLFNQFGENYFIIEFYKRTHMWTVFHALLVL